MLLGALGKSDDVRVPGGVEEEQTTRTKQEKDGARSNYKTFNKSTHLLYLPFIESNEGRPDRGREWVDGTPGPPRFYTPATCL